jgi:hypothetical protein
MVIYVILEGESDYLQTGMITTEKSQAIRYILNLNSLDWLDIQFWEKGVNVGDFNKDNLEKYIKEENVTLEEFLNENM